jgi:site-specific recombinase XerD
MDLMRQMGWDDNGFVAKCNAWKQFFRYWQGEGLKVLDYSLIPVPSVDYKMPKVLKKEDFKLLMDALKKHRSNILKLRNLAALSLLFDCGCRLGEFLSLKVTDLDMVNMRAVIKTEKSRGIKPTRMIFWTKETNKLLKEYLAAREEFLKQKKYEDEEWLWICAYGTWNCGKRWRPVAVETLLKRLSKEANLGYTANPHSFRHHFGRNLAMQGANNSIISDMMGHADMNSTRIYTVMSSDTMQDTYDKFFKKR